VIKDILDALDKFRWVVLAFIAAGLLVAGLLIWQLLETTPGKWCAVAGINEISASGCFQLLLALVTIKDHAIIGLLVILGVTVISVVAVTLKLRIQAEGPGGAGLQVGPLQDVMGPLVPKPPEEDVVAPAHIGDPE
jgi:hypothetical protein